MAEVRFTYHTGLTRSIFRNPRLVGSWDESGRYALNWSESPMVPVRGEEGCDVFTASVRFDDSQIGQTFRWGVVFDTPAGPNQWAIPTEIKDAGSADRYREFTLQAGMPEQHYWFTQFRRLGSQKWAPQGANRPALRFAVWAPNAKRVDVVFAKFDPADATATGYIADDGAGIDLAIGENGAIPLRRGDDDIWTSDPNAEELNDWSKFSNVHTCTASRPNRAKSAIAPTCIPEARLDAVTGIRTAERLTELTKIWTAWRVAPWWSIPIW